MTKLSDLNKEELQGKIDGLTKRVEHYEAVASELESYVQRLGNHLLV